MSSSAIKDNGILSMGKENRLPPPPIEVLKQTLGLEFLTIEWLAGDGSDRCYYRIKSPSLGNSLVLMQLSSVDEIALREDKYDWVTISNELNRANIKAPKARHILKDYAAIIIDDYGDKMLESSIKSAYDSKKFNDVRSSIEKSLPLVIKMLKLKSDDTSPWISRAFDKEKYQWEFNFFKDKYLEMHRGIILNKEQSFQYETEISRMSELLGKQSNYFTHRDFHSRNIMVLDTDDLALIDFQDARLGSPLYDWASICFDSYIPVSIDDRFSIFKAGINQIKASVSSSDGEMIDKYWPLIVIQRSIKALASFAYLEIEKERGSYLTYEPTILNFLKNDQFNLREYPFFNKILKDISK